VPLPAAGAGRERGRRLSWRSLSAAREDLLRELSPPILSAVGNEDTPSPLFHGCFDWHSAVHGVYSLYAIYDRTGEDLYLEAAAQHARPELVADELRYMSTAILEEENPYGFAWLLALVARQERVTGTRELRPLADFAAHRVGELVRGLDSDAASERVSNDRYGNLSWALLHLALWARHTQDDTLLELAQETVRRHLQSRAAEHASPLEAETGDVIEFMAPGLMRLAAIGTVLGADARRYLRAQLPAGFAVPPLTEPTTNHAAGVNFFRALALWHIYRATGAKRMRENVARLVLYQAGRADLWRESDYGHRHWIAQIGVRVIDDSYDDDADGR
jgi:Protein of unknown function (DUF2891)